MNRLKKVIPEEEKLVAGPLKYSDAKAIINHKNSKYAEGICMFCHDPKEVRHINVYPNGSEGLFICRECELKKLLPFIRDASAEVLRKKKAMWKRSRICG